MDYDALWAQVKHRVSQALRTLLTLAVLIALFGLASACGHSYFTLSTSTPRVVAISPAITDDISSLFRSGADLASGDLHGAAERIVEDVDFKIEVEVTNRGVVPVYLGTSDHTLILNGVAVTDPIAFEGGWVGPDSTAVIPVTVTLLLTELPGTVVLSIVQGGLVEVQLESRVGWGILSKTIHTNITRYHVVDSVESMVRGLLPN